MITVDDTGSCVGYGAVTYQFTATFVYELQSLKPLLLPTWPVLFVRRRFLKF
ncbi:MAG: hypothetical protein JXB34_00750 [Bacteroidales bacterium]|nr:hypothetical protein [Bacteroidales bacterium]